MSLRIFIQSSTVRHCRLSEAILILICAWTSANANELNGLEQSESDCRIVIQSVDQGALQRDQAKTEAQVIRRMLNEVYECPPDFGLIKFTDSTPDNDEITSEIAVSSSKLSPNSEVTKSDRFPETVSFLDANSSLEAMDTNTKRGDHIQTNSVDLLPGMTNTGIKTPSPSTATAAMGTNKIDSLNESTPGVDTAGSGTRSDMEAHEHMPNAPNPPLQNQGTTPDQKPMIKVYREGMLHWAVLVEELLRDDYSSVLYEAYQVETDPILKTALAKELTNYLVGN